MARAAFYGHIQPSEFRQLEYGLGILLADLVTKMHMDELDFQMKWDTELAKVQIQATGAAGGAALR